MASRSAVCRRLGSRHARTPRLLPESPRGPAVRRRGHSFLAKVETRTFCSTRLFSQPTLYAYLARPTYRLRA